MKKVNILFLFLLLASPLFMACERELETEGLSRITNYPTFNLVGGDIMTVVAGDPNFTVPEPIVTEAGVVLPFTTSIKGSGFIDPAHSTPAEVEYTDAFDINTPGMYAFTYAAKNSDGFTGTAVRRVFVFDKAPDPTVDLSGSYTSGTSPAAKITKLADGVFFSSNAWGGGSVVVIPAYLMTADGLQIEVPLQESTENFYGYGTRNPATGTLNLIMSRPDFASPLFNQAKNWEKKQ